jgi:AraC-like DNA-binding protein
MARTARVQRAKRLLDETTLPLTEIAMRAGFGSLRRFNSVFVEVCGRPPTKMRRTQGSAGKAERTVEDVTQEEGALQSSCQIRQRHGGNERLVRIDAVLAYRSGNLSAGNLVE